MADHATVAARPGIDLSAASRVNPTFGDKPGHDAGSVDHHEGSYCPASSVADLTFLPALPRVIRRNVKSKATLES
jgi:hypothetical protein